jgi:tRNA-2-methylthio-N6-dimethylallyladenosine synthase
MIRSFVPNMSITSDVIVGYPTETDADFEDTMSLLEECRLDNIYSFKYNSTQNKEEDKIKWEQFFRYLPGRLRKLRLNLTTTTMRAQKILEEETHSPFI